MTPLYVFFVGFSYFIIFLKYDYDHFNEEFMDFNLIYCEDMCLC